MGDDKSWYVSHGSQARTLVFSQVAVSGGKAYLTVFKKTFLGTFSLNTPAHMHRADSRLGCTIAKASTSLAVRARALSFPYFFTPTNPLLSTTRAGATLHFCHFEPRLHPPLKPPLKCEYSLPFLFAICPPNLSPLCKLHRVRVCKYAHGAVQPDGSPQLARKTARLGLG